MAIINVSVPEPVQEWVEAQVERGRYRDVSAYLGDLIRRDQDEDDRAAIVAALVEGEQSGIAARRVPEIVAALKAECLADPD